MEFLAEFGIVSMFLFDRFTTNKSRLVPTIIGSYDKVDASVDAHNMADIRKMTLFDLISNRDMQKYLPCFLTSLAVPNL